jgi:hypothetical protein
VGFCGGERAPALVCTAATAIPVFSCYVFVSRLVLDIYFFSSLAGISSICKIFKIFGGIERHFRAKKRALNGISGPKEGIERHIGPKEGIERHIGPKESNKRHVHGAQLDLNTQGLWPKSNEPTHFLRLKLMQKIWYN